jgi:hypothetical protein
VRDDYDDLLQAFIGCPVLDLPGLIERSGLDKGRITMVLNRFKKIYKGMFEHVIDCPGPHRRGEGYRATVVDAQPAKPE